ncbi:MAG: hypothetical protein AAGB19_22320, partial [Cyanobacteria bacterium P01_F01_bin.3]
AIALSVPVTTVAEEIVSSFETKPSGAEAVGLRIDRSRIVTAFSGHLSRFFGDCPGSEWTGSATKDNVRFISQRVPPSSGLRVELLNLTSGESITKKYTKEGRGSFDFRVINLGLGNGPQDIEYRIFDKASNATLDQGNFSYDLTTTSRSFRRDGSWRSELFCANDRSASLNRCEVIGRRQRLYCGGSKTSTIRGEYISHRRNIKRRNKHRKFQQRH